MKNLLILLFFMLFVSFAKAQMVSSSCSTLIVNAIVAQNPSTDPAQIKPYWDAVCEGIIATVKTAVVSSTGVCTVTSGSSAGPHPTTSTGGIQ